MLELLITNPAIGFVLLTMGTFFVLQTVFNLIFSLILMVIIRELHGHAQIIKPKTKKKKKR